MPMTTKNFSDIITFTRTGSTATYFNSAGVLTSAAADQPRFDYDPVTLAARGLLIEEQRSNIVYPSNFSSIGTVAVNNAWYEVNATLDTTVNAGVAPDGTTTAALLAINAPTTFNAAQYRTTSTTAATYAFSCFCKANSTDTLVRLQVSGDTGFVNLVRADFTLTGVGAPGAASAVGTATAPSAPTIQPVGNGWYRCTIIVALTAPTNITCAVYPGTTGAQTTASQTLVWGAQLEAGAFPTSYIPTTVAQVTRNADQASVNTLSPWYNATASTVYFEGTVATVSDSQNPYFWSISDNTKAFAAREQIAYTRNTSSAQTVGLVAAGGATNASVASSNTAVTANTVFKAAASYAANDVKVCVNGLTPATTASATLPTGLNTLKLGAPGWSGAPVANAFYVRRFTYYPRSFASAELQSLTA